MGLEAVNGTTTAPATNEVVVETMPNEAKKEGDFLSPRFAALAKKEKAIRQAKEEVSRERERLKLQEEDYKARYIPKDRLKTEWQQVLQEQGIGVDQITQMAMNQPGPQDQMIQKLQARIDELENKQTESFKKQEENQTSQYTKALDAIRLQVKDLVTKDDNYQVIKATAQEEAVVELIEKRFQETGIVPSVESATREVEETILKEMAKYSSIGKVRALFEAKEAALEVPVKKPEAPGIQIEKRQIPQQPIKTLTNAATAVPSKPLSARDRRERAIAAFKGVLS